MAQRSGLDSAGTRPPEAAGTDAGSASMPRVAVASFVGTVIEMYDFHIFGTAAALVFPHIFFPALGTAAGVIASFATLGVAFVARPLGSVLFGHFGDRLGRKKTLIATMLMMGVGTFLIGLMPTASQIGVAAPILVVLLRIMQGLAAGGEWAGGVLFGAENAPPGKRGLWSMFPALGGGIAIALANMTFFITGMGMDNAAFVSWGWRIPFLTSALLVLVGLWVRVKLDETPVFKNEVARGGPARLPFIEALRNQPKEILLATGVAMATAYVLAYVGGPYLTSYGTSALKLAPVPVLAVAMVGGLAVSAGVLLGALLSDRIGRRKVIIGSLAVAVLWSLVLFPIVDTKSMLVFAVGAPFTMFIAGLGAGPLGGYFSELFHTRYRYTAAGFAYSLGGIFGGALPPLLAASITAAFGGIAFGVLMAGLCFIGLLCTVVMRETHNEDLHTDQAASTG